jgi:hypothetical protein
MLLLPRISQALEAGTRERRACQASRPRAREIRRDLSAVPVPRRTELRHDSRRPKSLADVSSCFPLLAILAAPGNGDACDAAATGLAWPKLVASSAAVFDRIVSNLYMIPIVICTRRIRRIRHVGHPVHV